MIPSAVEARALLREVMDEEDVEHFERCRIRSVELMEAVQRLILEAVSDDGRFRDVSWIATGSVGRLEATEESDLDLIALYPAAGAVSPRDLVEKDQTVRALISERIGIKVSEGRELTSPTEIEALCKQARIGGSGDSVEYLTKRNLILTESRAITSPAIRDRAHEAVLGAFADFTGTRGRHLLSLINDIARYYRTLMVDYKSRVDSEGKAWGLRNIKLRHSRKFWYVSTMLSMIYAATRYEHRPEAEEKLVRALFDMAPVERLVVSLDGAGMLRHTRAIALYNRYLGEVSLREVRQALEKLKHEDRYSSEVFRRLKRNADEFHEALFELVVSLPLRWRRHLFSHFLL